MTSNRPEEMTPMRSDLTARVILVTGSSGNLGHAAARAFADAGATVVGFDRLARADSPVADMIAGIDLTDTAAVSEAVSTVRSRFGGIDGLCNIAGGFSWTTLADGGAQAWEAMFRLNVLTAVNMCAAAAPLMNEGGSIVNVGAASADRAAAGMGPYGASKSAVARLTESLAAELKDRPIRVNAVLPTIIDTPANRADMPDANPADWVAPDALADVLAFLMSDASRAITGALIPVRGRVL